MALRVFFIAIGVLTLGGCMAANDPAATETDIPVATAPPGAEPGTCWGQSISPAVVETVIDQIILQPAEVDSAGNVINPAIYKTETRQNIIKERRETWFRTPCEDQLTEGHIASLQRALKARGLYRGTVTGEMDRRTKKAIRNYQKPQGLDSDVLSLNAARQLGLVAVERETL